MAGNMKSIKTLIADLLPDQILASIRKSRSREKCKAFLRETPELVFTSIAESNYWGDPESLSGPGSSLAQTAVIRHALPALFRKYDIRTVLDLPCGDFHWMKDVDFSSIDSYTGGDIVEKLVENNSINFKHLAPKVNFCKLNLIEDDLPRSDLLICRDCLVHLPFLEIEKSLENVKRSGIRYLLVTSFPKKKLNHDIVMGDWRPLNLELSPFRLPAPIDAILEECTEKYGGGINYDDKSLLLFKL